MESWTLTNFDSTFHIISFCHKMSNILIYVQVAPATPDIQSILEIPTVDEINAEDQNHGLAMSNNGIYNMRNSQLISMYTVSYI